jgi:hypothetical protein
LGGVAAGGLTITPGQNSIFNVLDFEALNELDGVLPEVGLRYLQFAQSSNEIQCEVQSAPGPERLPLPWRSEIPRAVDQTEDAPNDQPADRRHLQLANHASSLGHLPK